MFNRACASLVLPSPHSVPFIFMVIGGGVEAGRRSFCVSCTPYRVSRTTLLGCAPQVLFCTNACRLLRQWSGCHSLLRCSRAVPLPTWLPPTSACHNVTRVLKDAWLCWSMYVHVGLCSLCQEESTTRAHHHPHLRHFGTRTQPTKINIHNGARPQLL